MNKPKPVISLFDLTGQMCKPWADAKYHTFQFDMQHAHGLNGQGRKYTIGGMADTWADRLAEIFDAFDVRMLLGFPPCTDLATSGAKHFQAKAEANPNYLADAMALVYQQGKPSEPYDRAHITITWVAKDKRRRDVDNLFSSMKGYLDGLVAAGVIVDDSAANVQYTLAYEHGDSDNTIISISKVNKLSPTEDAIFCPYCKCRLPDNVFVE